MIAMWMPKACQRCGGDLYKTTTSDGEVLSCLQCGREILAAPARPFMSREEMRALFAEEEPRAA